MKPFFDHQRHVIRLLAVADRWLGTPWCANSQSIGERGGVSCHNLPRAIYIECGALPPEFPKFIGDPNGTRHGRVSEMEPVIDARPEFRRLAADEPRQPGDLIGLRIYHCVDHLGVLLCNHIFIHVLMHKKTDMDWVNVPPWQQRSPVAWRPLAVPQLPN